MARATEKATPAGAEPVETSYDVLVARLEKVVEALEDGQLPLEASVEKFAEGVQLARDASRKLDEAERRVEQLLRTDDGSVETRPLGESEKGP